jgi:hypothetical protein
MNLINFELLLVKLENLKTELSALGLFETKEALIIRNRSRDSKIR